jgi:hypothetical protein
VHLLFGSVAEREPAYELNRSWGKSLITSQAFAAGAGVAFLARDLMPQSGGSSSCCDRVKHGCSAMFASSPAAKKAFWGEYEVNAVFRLAARTIVPWPSPVPFRHLPTSMEYGP